MLCRVRLVGVGERDRETMKSFFVDALEKEGLDREEPRLNYMGGELCGGKNDMGEECPSCSYMPWVVRKYLKKGKYRV